MVFAGMVKCSDELFHPCIVFITHTVVLTVYVSGLFLSEVGAEWYCTARCYFEPRVLIPRVKLLIITKVSKINYSFYLLTVFRSVSDEILTRIPACNFSG